MLLQFLLLLWGLRFVDMTSWPYDCQAQVGFDLRMKTFLEQCACAFDWENSVNLEVYGKEVEVEDDLDPVFIMDSRRREMVLNVIFAWLACTIV